MPLRSGCKKFLVSLPGERILDQIVDFAVATYPPFFGYEEFGSVYNKSRIVVFEVMS